MKSIFGWVAVRAPRDAWNIGFFVARRFEASLTSSWYSKDSSLGHPGNLSAIAANAESHHAARPLQKKKRHSTFRKTDFSLDCLGCEDAPKVSLISDKALLSKWNEPTLKYRAKQHPSRRRTHPPLKVNLQYSVWFVASLLRCSVPWPDHTLAQFRSEGHRFPVCSADGLSLCWFLHFLVLWRIFALSW